MAQATGKDGNGGEKQRDAQQDVREREGLAGIARHPRQLCRGCDWEYETQ